MFLLSLLWCQSLSLVMGGLGFAFLCSLVWVLWGVWGVFAWYLFVFSWLLPAGVCLGFVSGGFVCMGLCRVMCPYVFKVFSFVGS